MGQLRANSLRDFCGYFFNLGLVAGVSAGAFLFLGVPPVLSLAAIGITAGVHYGLIPKIRKELQNAIDDERRTGLPSEAGRTSTSTIKSWVKDFSHRYGIKKTPQVLVMPDRLNLPDLHDRSLKGSMRHFLRKEFNKHANAFAFSYDKDNVVLTDPIVRTLNKKELKGVVAHEVGHLAAGHNQLQQVMSLVSTPAKILTGLNFLVSSFSGIKNAGLFVAANGLSNVATNAYATVSHLDEALPKDKAKIKNFRRYAFHASLAAMAVTFQAPDLLIAQGLNLVTGEVLNLIEKRQSRLNEFQADRLAAQVTGDPQSMCDGLKKIKDYQLRMEPGFNYDAAKKQEREPGILSSLFEHVSDLKKTHPSVARRCAELGEHLTRKFSDMFGPSGLNLTGAF